MGTYGNMSHTLTAATGLQLRHTLTAASTRAGHCHCAPQPATTTSSTLHSARNRGGWHTWATVASQAATPSNSILAQTIAPTARPQGIAMSSHGSRSTNQEARDQGPAALNASPAQVNVPTASHGHPRQALLRSRRNR